jgi:hypothetical protein
VFGAERTGLTNDELARCQGAVRIPTDPVFSSLNLAAAVQVLCYELRVAALAATAAPEARRQAPGGDDQPRRWRSSKACSAISNARSTPSLLQGPLARDDHAAPAPPLSPRRAQSPRGPHPARHSERSRTQRARQH